jgi:hypothetical protein
LRPRPLGACSGAASVGLVQLLLQVLDSHLVADGASELLRDVFGPDKVSSRLVFGVASLPLGTSVELEVIFEVRP